MVKCSREFYRKISKIGLEKRWKKEHSKVRIKKKMSPEKAAIHAYLCGDGCIKARADNRGYPHHDIRIYPDNYELAKTIVSFFQKEFNIEPKIRDLGNYFRIEIGNKPAFLNLIKIGYYNTYKWEIPRNLKRKSLIYWLRAFFDCESCVDLNNNAITLKSVNFEGLLEVNKKLKIFGIKSRVYGPYQPKNLQHSPMVSCL